jgi:hypothetical protein
VNKDLNCIQKLFSTIYVHCFNSHTYCSYCQSYGVNFIKPLGILCQVCVRKEKNRQKRFVFVINHLTASKCDYLGTIMTNKSAVHDEIMKSIVE